MVLFLIVIVGKPNNRTQYGKVHNSEGVEHEISLWPIIAYDRSFNMT